MRWIVILAVLSVASGVSANDASFGGNGTDLIPQRESRVRMVAEDILLEMTSDKEPAWRVTARYTFENPTDAPVKLQVGFPEFACTWGGEGCHGKGGVFRGMKTTVGGKRVKGREGKLAREHEWSEQISRVFLYDIEFPAQKQVEVVHRYTYDRSVSVDGEWVSYLTRTGALWNGPIGHARFTIRTPRRPWGLSWPPEYELTSYRERKKGRGAVTEMVFEARKWTPTRDFVVQLFNEFVAGEHHKQECPLTFWVKDGHLEDELSEMTDEQLRICRNLPYAHHGYPFKKSELRALFYKPAQTGSSHDAFHPGAQPDVDDPATAWRWIIFAPNPDYTPSLLSPREVEYVRLLKAEEARRKKGKK